MHLEKFVDRLPIPPLLKPVNKRLGLTYYKVEMKQFKQKLHRDLPETTVWGYEGMYPGPTFEVRRNELVRVKWINSLPIDDHLLPVDTTLHGAEPDQPRVRTVVHLHGSNVPPDSDGNPDAWFTNKFAQTGPQFITKIYSYPNKQRATTLWYHDHAVGITRLNVYAGLAGFYLIRDDFEDSLNLPGESYEVPLVIQDRTFNEDGSLFYPRGPEDPPDNLPDPSVVPEFFGDTILVNGKVWPYLEVEPRKYRFRFLNGSNSRFYRMKLDPGGGKASPPWFQIGSDGGMFDIPVPLDELILGPAERADIIVDFTSFSGVNIIITNDAPTPFAPDAEEFLFPETKELMQFRVNLPLQGEDTSSLPSHLRPIYRIPEVLSRKSRDLTLVEETDQFGRLFLLLTGRVWSDPITEKPQFESIEIWNLINLTEDTHPIHLHLVQFQLLDRQPFDVDFYLDSGELIFTGAQVLPDPNERGWKDTVRANPGEVTRIIARFGDFAGLYLWHCHILEHEDHEMMRPYRVVL